MEAAITLPLDVVEALVEVATTAAVMNPKGVGSANIEAIQIAAAEAADVRRLIKKQRRT